MVYSIRKIERFVGFGEGWMVNKHTISYISTSPAIKTQTLNSKLLRTIYGK